MKMANQFWARAIGKRRIAVDVRAQGVKVVMASKSEIHLMGDVVVGVDAFSHPSTPVSSRN